MRLRTFTALAAAVASLAQSAAGTAARYFSNPFGDGSIGAPDRTATQLHVLLSEQLHH